MLLLNAVQGVLSIMLMLGIGYYLSYKKWFDENSSKLFSRLVVNIALPAYMISNLMGTYDREELLHLKNGLAIPFLAMGICYCVSFLFAKVARVPHERIGTFRSMFSLSNTIFVGLPVNLALFGEESISFVLLYYIANTTLFWTIGVYGISRDGKNKGGLFSINSIKRIFSPPLTAFLIAVVLIMLKVTLPKGIMDVCKYMGGLTTPLSMFFIGMVIYSVKVNEIKLDRGMAALLLGRFLIAPIIVIALCSLFPVPLLMKKVFIIQSAMPAMTQTSIIAEAYNADYKYAGVMTTVTTALCLVIVPFYILILSSGLIV